MARRRYYKKDDDLEQGLTGIVVLGIVALFWYFYNNPQKSIAILLGFVAIIFLIFLLIGWWRKRRFDRLLNKLKNLGQEDYLKNFINRFGFESGKGENWSFRNRKISYDRINDLRKILKETGVSSNKKDVFNLLQFYIRESEENLTRESIKKEPQKLFDLSGAEFEKLLYRLFEAMGYKTEWMGRPGDQGGDLIANKNGKRILVQAKRYQDSSTTGNAAVQQATAAMKYYDCNDAMVITSSHFTNEAISLAMANNVELISRERLQELLLKYLGESWA